MYNIIICDDNPQSVTQIENCLLDVMNQNNYEFQIEAYYSGERFLTQFLANEICVDILFLDIEMEHKSGIEVARAIRAVESELIIIFFSSHEKYLIELFEVSPFRFIKKPIEPNKVHQITLSAIQKLNRNLHFFEYTFKQKKPRFI